MSAPGNTTVKNKDFLLLKVFCNQKLSESHEHTAREASPFLSVCTLNCSPFINIPLIQELCHNFREVSLNDVERVVTM